MRSLYFEGLKGSFTLTKGVAVLPAEGDKAAQVLEPKEYKKIAAIHAVQIDRDFGVNSEEGTLLATAGDWLAEGPAGELWSIKEDIFAATYVPVEVSETRAEGLSRLDVRDGDILHVTLGILDMGDGMGPWIPTAEDLDQAREGWEEVLPKGVSVIVTHFGDLPNVVIGTR